MITQEQIEQFIRQIPPAPDTLRRTMAYVNEGELTKAAKSAQGDAALSSYLKTLVNRPIYGFRNEVTDVSQIFGILGVSGAQQVLYNYMLNLLSPSEWKLFGLSEALFFELQATFNRHWGSILAHLKIDDKEIESAITLLPAAIIVCEALFASQQADVALLRQTKALDYNTILKRLCGKDLFDVCELIAQSWEMPAQVSRIVQCASGVKSDADPQIERLGAWMHMLLFYMLSQNAYVEAGLNDFVDFHPERVETVYPEFMEVIAAA